MRFFRTKSFLSLLIATVLLVLSYLSGSRTSPQPANNRSTEPTATLSASLKVTRVIDGDTIELENGQKVRYTGIDTPELHHPKKAVQCFGKEAMQKNKELVEGKVIRMEKDISETDKYGRLLRYVYIEDQSASPSSLFVNAYLVKEGYAFIATFPPDIRYADTFMRLEQEARTNHKGLWQSCREVQ